MTEDDISRHLPLKWNLLIDKDQGILPRRMQNFLNPIIYSLKDIKNVNLEIISPVCYKVSTYKLLKWLDAECCYKNVNGINIVYFPLITNANN